MASTVRLVPQRVLHAVMVRAVMVRAVRVATVRAAARAATVRVGQRVRRAVMVRAAARAATVRAAQLGLRVAMVRAVDRVVMVRAAGRDALRVPTARLVVGRRRSAAALADLVLRLDVPAGTRRRLIGAPPARRHHTTTDLRSGSRWCCSGSKRLAGGRRPNATASLSQPRSTFPRKRIAPRVGGGSTPPAALSRGYRFASR